MPSVPSKIEISSGQEYRVAVSLAPGRKLAHYEILEPIGKGGMGEVYRSKDSQLGRDVAIKVLPEEFSRNKERSERFEREARLLAQLNHTNIATLHGFEESEGRQFLVMELVEGETLAERIARRPLTWNEAVLVFGQIADGIEAAHAKGIVHRDLKPANIKLAADGRPKILDYGLAKAWAGDVTPDSELSQSPTLAKGSELGAITGTPSYMSPEQARGEPVDGRTDVWAFACCLYEALTGDKAFPGKTTADVFAAIMNTNPRWEALPGQGGGRLQKLLERCLQKDVHQRLRGVEHARLELEALTANADVRLPSSRDRRAQLLPWLVALGAAALAVVAYLRPAGDRPEPSPVRFSLQLPAGDRLLAGFSGNLAISPDGRRVAYGGIRGMEQYSLFLRSMDRLEPEPEPVPDSEGAGNPFFSPDGLSIGFTSVRGPLKRAAIGGGTSVELVRKTDRSGAFWAPDGYIYFSPQRGAGIARILDQGGGPEIVVPLREDLGDVDLRAPHVLPGGGSLLFVVRDRSGRDRIAVETLRSGERRVLIEDGSSPQYARSGHLVFARKDKILATRFDLNDLVVDGNPTVVVDGLIVGSRGPVAAGYNQFAVSDHGALIYIDDPNTAGQVSQIVSVDRQGAFTPLVETPRRFWNPRWSPRGDRLAVAIYDEQRWDLWTHDVSRETLTRLTFSGRVTFRPVWSPDGTRLFEGTRSLDPNGGDEPKPLLSSPYVTIAASVSPDGDMLVYRQSRPETGWDIVFQRVGNGDDVEIYLDTPFDELHPGLSPDGRYLPTRRTNPVASKSSSIRFRIARAKFRSRTRAAPSPSGHPMAVSSSTGTRTR